MLDQMVLHSAVESALKKERNAGLPYGCYLLQLSLTMSDGTHLTTWVTRETKERFAAVARHQGLSDSALLKRLVALMLQSAGAAEVGAPGGAGLPYGCYLLQLSLTMSDGTHLTTWVTHETKERFAAVARHQGLSDSALLKRL